MTGRGERFVEDLRSGDQVLTKDYGLQSVKAVYIHDVDLSEAPELRPILVRANTFGARSSSRALFLSPYQRVALRHPLFELFFGTSEVLLRAEFLIEHPGVSSASGPSSVTYVSLNFAMHQLLYCGDLAVDTGGTLVSSSRPTLSKENTRVALNVLGHRPTTEPRFAAVLH